MTTQTYIVSYGGGTNSCACILTMYELDIKPAAIVFCDTGAEKPHTYEHIETMNFWLDSVGWPRIVTARASGESIEENIVRRETLPPIAFGWKTCSQRWKRQPFIKWCKDNGYIEYTMVLGIDAGELHRADKFPENYYPLIDCGYDREDCIELIKRYGLQQPGKSACYMCPSSKKQEVVDLKREYPTLYARACAIEEAAEKKTVFPLKG